MRRSLTFFCLLTALAAIAPIAGGQSQNIQQDPQAAAIAAQLEQERLEEEYIRTREENGQSHASGARPELGPVIRGNPTEAVKVLRVGLHRNSGTTEFGSLHHSFVELTNTKIELLEPYGEDSPVKGFLAKNPSGGMHHVCYEVEDILAARDKLKAEGARVLGDGNPKIGAHDKPVLFLHPKDFCGTLVELEQV